MPNANDDAGVWRLPGGDDAYRYFLRLYTTTAKSPAEIHALGLERVAAIEQQMDAVFRRIGRDQGSVQQRIDTLKAELAYPDPTSEASRSAVMHDIDVILADAQVRAQALFNLRPNRRSTCGANRRSTEGNASAHSACRHRTAAVPGMFWVPLRGHGVRHDPHAQRWPTTKRCRATTIQLAIQREN